MSDIELGGFLHSSGNRKWLRRTKQVTLGFIEESFIISVQHHSDINVGDQEPLMYKSN